MRHTLEPVFDIFPKWRPLLRVATTDDGSTFHLIEVPAPEGSDAASGLLVRTAGDEITVGFDLHDSRFQGWAGETGALDLVRRLVTERVAVVSWWSRGGWCGSGWQDAGRRPEVPAWVAGMAVDAIRVRSWRGALNADVEWGR